MNFPSLLTCAISNLFTTLKVRELMFSKITGAEQLKYVNIL